MPSVIDNHVRTLTERLIDENEAKELERQTLFTLGDAMRLGCKVTGHAQGFWVDEDDACALSSGLIGAKSLGYMP